jgi:glycosyltransferase involved in cell wall biosynthesis
MRIAIDIRHLTAPNPSGVGLYTINIINALATLAPKVEFVLFASGRANTLAYLPTFPADNITVVTKPIPNRLLMLMIKLRLVTLEQYIPQTIDLWWFPNTNFIRTKRPYVQTIHDLSFELFPQFFTLKDRLQKLLIQPKRLATAATNLVTVSKHTKQDLIDRWQIPAEHIFVTPLGVSEYMTATSSPRDEQILESYEIAKPYFLTLCTREPRKNLETAIQAFDQWKTSHPTNTQLVIAGGRGWKTNLASLIQKTTHADDIKCIGYVDEADKPTLYRGAKFFLFPSFYEGYGLPVVESLSCGTPVIAGFNSSLTEVAETGITFVDPYNVQDLVRALEQHVPQTHTSSQHRPSWSETAQQMLHVFEHVNDDSNKQHHNV